MRKRRNPRIAAATALVLAAMSLSSVASSPRWEQIHTVDAIRLIASGMLLGVALVANVRVVRGPNRLSRLVAKHQPDTR